MLAITPRGQELELHVNLLPPRPPHLPRAAAPVRGMRAAAHVPHPGRSADGLRVLFRERAPDHRTSSPASLAPPRPRQYRPDASTPGEPRSRSWPSGRRSARSSSRSGRSRTPGAQGGSCRSRSSAASSSRATPSPQGTPVSSSGCTGPLRPRRGGPVRPAGAGGDPLRRVADERADARPRGSVTGSPASTRSRPRSARPRGRARARARSTSSRGCGFHPRGALVAASGTRRSRSHPRPPRSRDRCPRARVPPRWCRRRFPGPWRRRTSTRGTTAVLWRQATPLLTRVLMTFLETAALNAPYKESRRRFSSADPCVQLARL